MLCDSIKWSNIHVLRVFEGKKREMREKKISEGIQGKNFPNLMKNINKEILKIHQNPKQNKLYTQAYLLKTKDMVLKTARKTDKLHTKKQQKDTFDQLFETKEAGNNGMTSLKY